MDYFEVAQIGMILIEIMEYDLSCHFVMSQVSKVLKGPKSTPERESERENKRERGEKERERRKDREKQREGRKERA